MQCSINFCPQPMSYIVPAALEERRRRRRGGGGGGGAGGGAGEGGGGRRRGGGGEKGTREWRERGKGEVAHYYSRTHTLRRALNKVLEM